MQRALPFLVFFIVLGAARIFGAISPESLGNLSPFGALFFCGMAFFGWRGVILPMAAWLISYPITNLIQGYSMSAEVLSPLLGFAAMVGVACYFRKSSTGKMFVGSLLAGVVFYLLTNTLSWATNPQYAPKSLATLGQALWTGLPVYAPTWLFFRKAMVAQALFTGLFLVANRAVVSLPARQAKTVSA